MKGGKCYLSKIEYKFTFKMKGSGDLTWILIRTNQLQKYFKTMGKINTNWISGNIMELPFISLSVIIVCDGLNAYAIPKFLCWSPNIPCDGTWRWGLWEIIWFRWGHEDGTPWWDQCPYNKEKEDKPECSFCRSCEDTERRQSSTSLEEVLTRNQICLNLDLGFPSLQNCEN